MYSVPHNIPVGVGMALVSQYAVELDLSVGLLVVQDKLFELSECVFAVARSHTTLKHV